MILGGQIRGDSPRIMLIYPQGNVIEASDDTLHLQIGESKTGKPMLDRLGGEDIPLYDCARLTVISLEATIRSNLSVGPPIDLVIMPKDTLAISQELRLTSESAFYLESKRHWQAGIEVAFKSLLKFEWEQAG